MYGYVAQYRPFTEKMKAFISCVRRRVEDGGRSALGVSNNLDRALVVKDRSIVQLRSPNPTRSRGSEEASHTWQPLAGMHILTTYVLWYRMEVDIVYDVAIQYRGETSLRLAALESYDSL